MENFFFRRQDHQFKNFFLILSLYFSFQRRIYINFVQYIFRIISFLPNFIISLHSEKETLCNKHVQRTCRLIPDFTISPHTLSKITIRQFLFHLDFLSIKPRLATLLMKLIVKLIAPFNHDRRLTFNNPLEANLYKYNSCLT